MNILKKKYFYFSYGTIGDMLMAAPFLEEIHAQDSGAVVVVGVANNFRLITEMSSEYGWIHFVDLSKKRNFFKLLPHLLFSRVTVIGPLSFGVLPKFLFVFMKVVSLGNYKNSPIGFTIGKEHTAYFAKKNDFKKYESFIDNLSDLLPLMNLKKKQITPYFHFKVPRDIAQTLPLTHKAYVVFHMCAANESRSLPASRWISLLEHLKDVNTDFDFVFTASKKDVDFVQQVLRGSGVSGIVVADRSIHDIAAILKSSALYVGVDTGITHIACVLGAKSVVIANNSNPTWLPRYNKNALILKNDAVCTCDGVKGGNCFMDFQGKKYFTCMFLIPDEDVVRAIKNSLYGHT